MQWQKWSASARVRVRTMVLVKGDWDLVEGPSGSAPSNTALSESAAALEARAEEIGRDLARDPALRRRAGLGADETEDETAALRRQCEAMQREIDELKAARARERETADREAFADYAVPPLRDPEVDEAQDAPLHPLETVALGVGACVVVGVGAALFASRTAAVGALAVGATLGVFASEALGRPVKE